MGKDKSGNNINNHIDLNKVGADFVNYYYNNLSDLQKLIDEEILVPFTKLKYNDYVYSNDELIQFLIQLSEQNIIINNINVLDSGSRRLDILINGTINDEPFSQYFLLCYLKCWYLKNSLLN